MAEQATPGTQAAKDTSAPAAAVASSSGASRGDPLEALNRVREKLNHPHGAALLAFLLGLVLFLPGLGSFGFWEPQETQVVDAITAYKSGGDTAALDPALQHPTLQMRILVQFARWMGTSEWALRLPLSLLGALGMAAVAFAAGWLWRPRAGIYAAIALGTSVNYLFQSRQLGGDVTSMAATALLIAMLAPLLASAKERKERWWLWLPLAAGAAAMAHFSCGALLGVALPCAGAGTAMLAGLLLRGRDGQPLIERKADTIAIAATLAGVALIIGIWA